MDAIAFLGTDEERAVCHNSAGPGGEGSGDEDFANDTISRDSPAHPGEELELLLKECGGPPFCLARAYCPLPLIFTRCNVAPVRRCGDRLVRRLPDRRKLHA